MRVDVRGRRILVTGGAGFIGSHTVDALIMRGADVVVVDNLSTGRRENINPAARFHELNIRDEAIEEIIRKERFDFIYHFAFFVLVPKSVENPLLDLDVIQGSLRLLKAAREISAKQIVFASSGFLYGNAAHLPVSEENPVCPISPYIVSKCAIENYLRFYRHAYDLPYVVLRHATIYGPRQVTGAMADYVRKLAGDQQAEMWGDGKKTRDYVFIEDAVNANMLALGVPPDHSCPVFNIGTGVETTLNDLYARIAKILKKVPRPIYHPDRSGELYRFCLDNRKAREQLGWAPEVSLDEGLSLTVAAYQGESKGCR